MSKAIIFPGQGSQIVGMTHDLYNESSNCRDLFDEANEILKYDNHCICSLCYHQYLLCDTRFYRNPFAMILIDISTF